MSRQADSSRRNAGEGEPKSRYGKLGSADWRGFVNLELAPALKEQAEDWLRTGESWEVFNRAVECGITLSFKADPSGAGSLASATQRTTGHVNSGLCVTARGRTADVAWGRLMYILHVFGTDDDWSVKGTVSDPDRW